MVKRISKRGRVNEGQRPFYETPEEMQIKIKEYFANPPDTRKMFFKLKDEVIEREVPCFTITGLVLYLGFADRQSFYDYEKNKPEFTCTMKRARSFIENVYEKLLQEGNPTGAIFALKNFGWKDKQEQEVYGKDGEALFPAPILGGKSRPKT